MDTFLLYDLATGTTRELTDPAPSFHALAKCPVLLRPDESIPNLKSIVNTWTLEFPGLTPALTALRYNLIRAHWNLLRAQSAAEEATFHFQLAAPSSGLPRRLDYIHRQSHQAERRFHLQLNHLSAWCNQAQTREVTKLRIAALKAAAKQRYVPAEEEPEDHPCPFEGYPDMYHQNAEVAVDPNGVIVHSIHPPNAEILGRLEEIRQKGLMVCRTILYRDGIPEVCRHPSMMTRDWHHPWQYLRIAYTADEFVALTDHEERYKPELLLIEPPGDPFRPGPPFGFGSERT